MFPFCAVAVAMWRLLFGLLGQADLMGLVAFPTMDIQVGELPSVEGPMLKKWAMRIVHLVSRCPHCCVGCCCCLHLSTVRGLVNQPRSGVDPRLSLASLAASDDLSLKLQEALVQASAGAAVLRGADRTQRYFNH